VGGNDLKQFFFAADRENERVRRRYDMLEASFLELLYGIVARCASAGTPLSFCGEDAGGPSRPWPWPPWASAPSPCAPEASRPRQAPDPPRCTSSRPARSSRRRAARVDESVGQP
jgi:hypothetical protein